MIKKLINRGESGIQLSSLILAAKFGIETGGKTPKGATDQKIIKQFNLSESKISAYKDANEWNVLNSDGTLMIGEPKLNENKGTYKFIKEHSKPILLNPKNSLEIKEWIEKNNIKTLNISGNKDSNISADALDRFWIMLNNALKTTENETL